MKYLRWIFFRRNSTAFKGEILRKKSSILYADVVPQPTSAIVLPPKILFIRLNQKFKIFKKSYFTRNISRTTANSEDGAICNNSLRLKPGYDGIFTRSSILNVGRGPRPAFDYNGIL